MKTEVRGIALSLIDFMGALLPGLVWLVMIATTVEMFRAGEPTSGVNPWTTFQDMLDGSCNDGVCSSLILLLGGLLLGYLVKPNVMDLTELITRPRAFFTRKREYRFPYVADHTGKGYFQDILRFLNDKYPQDWKTIPGHQPFTLCKRIIKSIDPALWEECEYREAELRFIGSLFLASIVSLALSVAANIRNFDLSEGWIGLSFVSAALLAQIFRKKRSREVGYTYLLFHVAIRTTGYKTATRGETIT